MYSVEYDDKAAKSLAKLDKPSAKLIYNWITNNLVNCENPRQYGKALIGDKKGYWRYRVGTYRIISQIDDSTVKILIIDIGHRKNIYSKSYQ